jgi:hypothetical protein
VAMTRKLMMLMLMLMMVLHAADLGLGHAV